MALIFPLWEMGMGHPLDQAGSSRRAYALCFAQKITKKKVNRGEEKTNPVEVHWPG